jgi:iron(III) transport system ATP-binding protein
MSLTDTGSSFERAASTTATPPGDPALVLKGICKYFTRRDGTKVPAVDGIDLEVQRGEFVVLLGPSGCGKTTLLRCIAGLESPDAGMITIHNERHYSSDQDLESSPDKRKLGMVFQSYALWPHMKVFSNVAYPLRVKRETRAAIRKRVNEVLSTVGIGELLEQYPGQLSGGQQQRVALARALVSSDGLILFDEPLSNVDAKVREQLRYEIRHMQRRIGFAAIYVTHDQEEAMELADRIAVLNKGKVAQLGTAQEIYEAPANSYVAKFIGVANEITGRISSVEGSEMASVDTNFGTVVGVLGERDLTVGDEVSVIARPENCQLVPTRERPEINEWLVEQATSVFMGASRKVTASVQGWGDVQVQYSSGQPLPDLSKPLRMRIPAQLARIYRR